MKSKPAVDCRMCGRGYKVDTFESCPHCGTIDTYGLIGGKQDFPEVCPHCKKRVIKSKPVDVPEEPVPPVEPAPEEPAPPVEQPPAA